MTNYSLIILRRIYLFESVKTHQLLLAPLVSTYSRVTWRRDVWFKPYNHGIINRDLPCWWYYSNLMSCSFDRAKSRGKGVDYSFWFQFNVRIVAQECTITGLKVRCRPLKGRAWCEICSVLKCYQHHWLSAKRGWMKATFVLPLGLDSPKSRVAANERLCTCLILKGLTIECHVAQTVPPNPNGVALLCSHFNEVL